MMTKFYSGTDGNKKPRVNQLTVTMTLIEKRENQCNYNWKSAADLPTNDGLSGQVVGVLKAGSELSP